MTNAKDKCVWQYWLTISNTILATSLLERSMAIVKLCACTYTSTNEPSKKNLPLSVASSTH